MSNAVENLLKAQEYAMSIRPQAGGFPYLAEAFRKFGIRQNIWHLPSCQSVYVTDHGIIVNQGEPLIMGIVDIPSFDRESLVNALRVDQAGESTFPEFLKAAWSAGVVSYVVDFDKRVVTYFGVLGESYAENYVAVELE